jgi:hypothetical protein
MKTSSFSQDLIVVKASTYKQIFTDSEDTNMLLN